ncbi:MAG: V-type ATPase subunit [Gammaproteobacteria bacterium]|nr:V-type ATPase subunit [Gammaproteobacteria bacterium]
MQSSSSAHVYLHTRVSLLADRLLSIEHLQDMIGYDLQQIIERIEQQFPDQPLDPATTSIENWLYLRMYTDFQMLLRAFNGHEYRFLKHAIHWFELFNLKMLIRGKFSGVSESALSEQLIDVGELAELPLQKLIQTDDPFEMFRLLEQTSYAGIVRQARGIFEEQGQELFSLDSALDRNFFLELVGRAHFLSLADRQQLNSVFGALLDRNNLLWLLRYRFIYGLSPAKSYYLLTATGNLLVTAELMKLAKLESLQSVIDELPAKLRALLAGQQDIYLVEQIMELYSLDAARRGLKKNNRLLTRTFAYLLLREAETRYLIAIIKGKQLGFDQDLISEAVGGLV